MKITHTRNVQIITVEDDNGDKSEYLRLSDRDYRIVDNSTIGFDIIWPSEETRLELLYDNHLISGEL